MFQKNFRYALCNNIVYIVKPARLRREIFLAFSAIAIAFLYCKSLSTFGITLFTIFVFAALLLCKKISAMRFVITSFTLRNLQDFAAKFFWLLVR